MVRRARRRHLSSAAAALLVAGALLAACSTNRTLDAEQLEADLAAQLLPDYPGAIRSISCPDAADPAPGQQFLCVATLGAQVIDVNVTLGGTDEALTSSAVVDARFVAVNEIAALLAATFGEEIGISTIVDCGQPVMVLAVDEPVVCTATDPGGNARDFDVRIDDTGEVTISLR